MSLVAYGASDDEDSETTDHEEEATVSVTTSNEKAMTPSALPSAGHISDEDDYEPTAKTEEYSSLTDHGLVSSTLSSQTLFTKGLPAPQRADNIIVEGDLEEEVKPKERELADAPKPPAKKQRQPVKITIPSLADTSDEDNHSSKKVIQASTKKSGLFSLLPAPIHSAKKEVNRALIPHSLKKKISTPQKPDLIPSQSTTKSTTEPSKTEDSDPFEKRMSQFNALTGYDSDSDEDSSQQESGGNFFSIDSTPQVSSIPIATSSSTITLPSTKDSASSLKGGKSHAHNDTRSIKVQSEEISSSDVTTQPDTKGDESQDTLVAEIEESVPEPGLSNDAPLDFGLQRSGLNSWAPHMSQSYLSPVGSSGPVQPYPSHGGSASAMYNLANVTEHQSTDDDTQPELEDDLRKFMTDKEFMRLQGKRKRGMEDEINFVDANVDDYVDPSEVSKHLTEETEYVSQKNKDNLPTSQQKRKKQITYLAHQAKERELELKNQWAQNRYTKKQTQSKYGF